MIARELGEPSYQVPIAKDEYYKLTRREMTTPRRSVEEFVRALQVALDSHLPVALADVAFVNGADLFLGRQLLQTGLAPRLLAYAGWNTAGNTLGTVLAHAVLHLLMLRGNPTPKQTAAQQTFLFRRYLDDYFYQAVARTQLIYEDLPALGLAPTMERLPTDKLEAVEARLRIRLSAAAVELRDQFVQAGLVREVDISNISLPWQRPFEVGFDIQVELP